MFIMSKWRPPAVIFPLAVATLLVALRAPAGDPHSNAGLWMQTSSLPWSTVILLTGLGLLGVYVFTEAAFYFRRRIGRGACVLLAVGSYVGAFVAATLITDGLVESGPCFGPAGYDPHVWYCGTTYLYIVWGAGVVGLLIVLGLGIVAVKRPGGGSRDMANQPYPETPATQA
jgi:hypothetical protein